MAPADYRAAANAARRKGMTLAEWVRQVLRASFVQEPSGRADRKIASIRSAVRQRFPAPDLSRMLAEIESGYGDERS